ncbi:MAG: choice-of-anchor D domain-containing protein [Kofleriaceae bacterium]
MTLLAWGRSSARAGTLSPATDFFDFDLVSVASGPSAAHPFVLTNGGGPTTITAITPAAGCSEFSFTTTPALPATLANGETLTVNVTYDPSDRTADSCVLTPVGPSSGGVMTVIGDGTAANLAITPVTSTAFGDVRWNTLTTATRDVTITNTGEEAANVSVAFAPAGQGFTASSTSFTLPAIAGSTVITVTFDPAGPGAKATSMSASAANAATPTANLTGNGVASNQGFSSGTYNFGSTPRGTGIAGAVTVTNTGAAATASLNISGVAITGAQATDFVLTDAGCTAQTCGAATVAIGGTRAYNVTCTPSAAGTRTATLSVTSDDPTSGGASSTKPTTISCTGVPPTLTVNPTAVNFPGNTRVGSPAPPATVTISNAAGAAPLTYAVVTSSAVEFPLVCLTHAGCAGMVAAGGSATITVGFVPQVVGGRSGSLTVTTNDPDPGDATRVIAVTGTGAVSTLAATSPLAFGDVDINTAGGVTRTLGLQNTGGVSLNVGAMSITGDPGATFSFAFGACTSGQSCPALAPINPGNTTTITLRCDPSTIGAKTGTLNIPTDDPASPNRTVALTCNGTTPDLQIAGAPLADFGPQRVGQLSSTIRTFTISNPVGTTTSPLTWTVGVPTGDFSRTCSVAACTGTINPGGATVTVTVRFTPTAVGVRTGNIAVTSNDVSTSTVNIPLSGTGIDATVSLVTPTPTTPPTVGGGLTFADTPVTSPVTASAMQAITIRNTGTDTLSVTSVTKGGANPGDFVVTGPMSTSITSGGADVTWNVQCAPTAQGTRSATITFNNDSSNDASVDVSVICSATRGHLFVVSATPVAYASGPNQIDFGDTFLMQSKVTTVTLRNDGNRAVTVSALAFASATQGFTFVPPMVTLPAVVMPNTDLALGIQFLPTLTTQGTTTVNLTTDWNPVAFSVTGNGQDSGVVYTRATAGVCDTNSITSFNFMQVVWNATATQQFCIKNIAGAPATINSSVLASPGVNFTVTGLPPNGTVLGSGQFRTFTVTADPNDTMLGTFTTTVTSTTTLPAPNDVKVLTLSVTSTGPGLTLAPGATLDFGGVDVDLVGGKTLPLTITNSGNAPLDLTGASGLSGSFTIAGGGAATLAPGAMATVMVTYDPSVERVSPTPESQTMVVNAVGYFDASGVRQAMGQQVIVTGYGIDQHVDVTADGAFGDVYRNPRADDPRASRQIQVCNTGEAPLNVTMISDPAAPFDVLGGSSLNVAGVSAPGAAPVCQAVTVEFRPADEAYQSYSSSLTLMNDDDGNPMVVVDVSGRSVPRPVTVPATLTGPPGRQLAVGVPVKLSELLDDGQPGLDALTATNAATPAEPFDIEVRPGANLAVIGAAARTLGNGATEVYDLTITADTAGPHTYMVDVYLDGDVFPHVQIPITVEAFDVPARDLYGCAAGRGGASWPMGLVAAVLVARRRRRVTAGRGPRSSA